MDKLKYASTENYVEGVIVEVKDGLVAIDLKGRMGQWRVPVRMLITDYELKLGLEVGFLLSYPEVLGPDINEKYAQNLEHKKQKQKEMEESK
ncbi:MAG: CBO2463/CBO2479 domain-containing protein [Peptostreptococcaceae bacterium]|nr:CBO2463/CBO2479 domain-containing protein [Peptostreptococcaceae bacterium]